MNKRKLLSCWLALTLCAALSASAQRIDRVIYFGDSLSDSGNHFLFTHQVTVPPYTLEPPTASYPIGWFHFSNGPTWAEYLADALHSPASGAPSVLLPGFFTNYSVGRARARDGGDPQFPTFFLTAQVNKFLADFHNHVPANSLVVIWIGSNDVDDAISAFFADVPNCIVSLNPSCQALTIIGAATAAIQTNIATLYKAGARRFLIADVPDISATPYVSYLSTHVNPLIGTVASDLTGLFDGALGQVVAAYASQFATTDPAASITPFDVAGVLAFIRSHPALAGFSDVTDRCTVPGVLKDAVCATPNTYLFWDAAHPTTAAHRVLAETAFCVLEPKAVRCSQP